MATSVTTIDINGATAKDIAAAITARKGETGVYAVRKLE